MFFFFFFSSRRRHTRFDCDWSSDVCSSDLHSEAVGPACLQNSGLLGNICECPVAIVVKQNILPAIQPRRAARDHEDRKSTRLNSSHSQISYAVFCLKKKKKKKRLQKKLHYV